MGTIQSLGFVHNRKPNLGLGGGLDPNQQPIAFPSAEGVIPDESIPWEKTTLGVVQVNQYLQGGATAYNTGVGYWLGHDGSAYKFFIGNSAGDKMTWDGATLSVTGTLVAGSIHIPDVDLTSNSFHVDSTGNMWIGATQSDFIADPNNAPAYILNDGTARFSTVTLSGSLVVSTSGSISSGQSAYNTGTGYWIEYNVGTPRLSIGNPATNYMTWDGADLTVKGSIIATSATITGVTNDTFTINDDLDDVTTTLSLGRTTGGNASWTWDGTVATFDKATDFSERVGLRGAFNIYRVEEPGACTAALAGAPGNIDNGAHRYKIQFVTDDGKTEWGDYSNTITVTDNSVDGQISLTNIPVSSDPRVTERRISRTKVGSLSTYYVLATIADNVTTTYTDNTADAGLGANEASTQDNTTYQCFDEDGEVVFFVGNDNFGFGNRVLEDLTYGNNNIGIGPSAVRSVTSGSGNIGVGFSALRETTTGANNVAVGSIAHFLNTTGSGNVSIGYAAGPGTTNASYCVSVGFNAGTANTSSNRLYIANSGTSSPLIYGEFPNTLLRFNASNVEIDGDLDFIGPQSITTSSGNLTITPNGGTVNIDADISFVGAQEINTSSGILSLVPVGDLYLNPVSGSVSVNANIDFEGPQSITTTSSNLTLAPAGDVVLDPVGNEVLPGLGYDINLGSLGKKYLTLHCAELWVETLVAQDTMATIGGRILVGPTTVLTEDLGSGETTITVKHNQMSSGDRVYMEADSKVEFMSIDSGPSGVGPYTYSVTRNLDGTGANDWYAGDAMFNTGTTGDGFIDIYSVAGVKSGTIYGPAITGNVRNSGTYNDWSEHWAIGQLNGVYGYGVPTSGVGLGEYAAGKTHITIDSTDGLRFYNGTTTVIGQWDTSGNITVGEVNAAKSNVYISAGKLSLRNNTTEKIVLNADGTAYFAGAITVGDGTSTSGTITLNHYDSGGDTYFGGGTFDAATWTATGGFLMGIDDSDSDKVKFYLGTSGQSIDWNVTTLNTLTVTGAINVSAGGTIGGFDVGADYLRDVADSFGLASTVTGGDDVRFWAGDTFANRATAPLRLTEAGVLTAVGAHISSTTSGARVLIFPDSNTGIQVIDDAAGDVFKAIIGGTDVGDVIMGDEAGGSYVKYDKSEDEFIIKTQKSNLKLYDAIVSTDGTGDYTTIQAAVTAGETQIFVRDGAYTVDADVNLTSPTSIIGESQAGVVITFTSSSYEIKAGPASVSSYSTGTISMSAGGDSVVTGVGTLWDANVAAGDYIQLNNSWYEIESVDSDTQITLTRDYSGIAITGGSYKILENIVAGYYLANFTLKGPHTTATQPFIHLYGVYDSLVENVTCECTAVAWGGSGIYMGAALKSTIRNCSFYQMDSGIRTYAVSGEYADQIRVEGCSFYDCDYGSFVIGNMGTITSSLFLNCQTGLDIALTDGTCSGNKITAGVTGILMAGARSTVEGNVLAGGTGKGIDDSGTRNNISNNNLNGWATAIKSVSSGVVISNNTIYVPEGAGVHAEGTYSLVSGNSIVFSGSGVQIGIYVSDDFCSISGNIISNSSWWGIVVNTAAGYCSVTGNTLYLITNEAIYVAGDYAAISGNNAGGSGTGVHTTTAASQTIIQSNSLVNNGTAIVDNGSNTLETPTTHEHNQE